MKRGHVPIRTCIGCREKRPAKEMIRLRALEDAVVVSHRKDKQPGRGCYVCAVPECIESALKKGRLARALRRNITSPPPGEALLRALQEKGVAG